jgi:hypothetical protein
MANKYTALKIPKKEELERLYFECLMNQKEIGEQFHTTQKVVFSWFKKLGIKSRIAKKRNQNGNNNHSWKGEKATYAAFHYRVYSARGKANHCEICGRNDNKIKYDWANISGKYYDVNDYKMMCRSCHFKMDGHKKNFPNNNHKPNINIRKLIDGKF